MTIVVGFVPTPEGDAALAAAISEARLREEPLHVVNTSRGDSLIAAESAASPSGVGTKPTTIVMRTAFRSPLVTSALRS